MNNNRVKYFRDGAEIAEIDAIDFDGTVRRGVVMRVPTFCRDGGRRPGFYDATPSPRMSAADAALADAYDAYERDLTNAWRDASATYSATTGAGGSAALRGKSKRKATEEFEAAHGKPNKLNEYDEDEDQDDDDDLERATSDADQASRKARRASTHSESRSIPRSESEQEGDQDDDDDPRIHDSVDRMMRDHAAKMQQIYSERDAMLAQEWRRKL